MKHVLIIGGAGYIGPIVSAHLLDAGYTVTCLDSLIYKTHAAVIPLLIQYPKYRFIEGDMRDSSLLYSAVHHGLTEVTDVILLAGLVGDSITKKFPVAARAINELGLIQVINQLSNYRQLDRVIFTSSCSNYGKVDSDILIDETYPLAPTSAYADAKIKIEQYLLGDITIPPRRFVPVVLRFATAFGLAPRTRFDLTINEFVYKLESNQLLEVFGANTWRPYCHVKDFGRLIQIVLEANSSDVTHQIFNAGSEDNNYQKQDIIKLILKEVPHGKVHYQEGNNDPRNYRVNFAKVYETLGFKPEYCVNDGIYEILDAIRNGTLAHANIEDSFYGNYMLPARFL